jgi:hypothetical protein
VHPLRAGGSVLNGHSKQSLSPEIRKAVEDGLADSWKESNEFKASQLIHGLAHIDGLPLTYVEKTDTIDFFSLVSLVALL